MTPVIQRDTLISFLGDFNSEKLKNPALKAARIGQNFGASWSFNSDFMKFTFQEDVCADKKKKKMYSDGIGCASPNVMKAFRQGLHVTSLAAVQIRHKGMKGVLSLNP